MRRRLSILTCALAVAAGVVPASADPWPVLQEPVLNADTRWTKTAWGYARDDLQLPETPHPTLFEMEGYSGAGEPNAYLRMDDGELMALDIRFGYGPRKDYARVRASTRGTECSGGSFNLYDRRHAWDAHHIIEWIAAQQWSNGRVGMHGSSFSGQTAYWTAATQPPHLYAVSANALHSDIYRDIFMPGGVQNVLFPSVWTYGSGPHRLPSSAFEDGYLMSDEICLQNQLTRYSIGDVPQPQNEPIWAGIRSVDDDWYTAHAAITYAPAIKIPYYQQNNWQDEQTGPRAVVLFNHIHPTPREIVNAAGERETIVPKTFSLSSGDHGWGQFHNRDLWNFLDIWLLDMPDVGGLYDYQVRNFFETRGDPTSAPFTAVKSGNTWPFEGTEYLRFHLRAGNALSQDAPTTAEAPDPYISGIPRSKTYFWETADDDPLQPVMFADGLPDVASYTSEPLTEDLVVAGPVLMHLAASMAGTDTDFFVTVSDVYPDGRVSYIQRGLLKASHRTVDPIRSYYDDGTLVQPYRPHTNPQPVQPNEIVDYDIEVFPIGHIFRKDHRLLVQIQTPPQVDGLWGYTAALHQPAVVNVHHDAEHPSWLQLPVVELDAEQPPLAIGGAPEGCKVPGGFPCTAGG